MRDQDTVRDALAAAWRLRWQSRLDEAEAAVREHVDDGGVSGRDRAALLEELARIELARGNFAEAGQQLDEALLAAGGADAHLRTSISERRAWTHFRQGNTLRAKETAEAALRDMPDDAYVEPAAGLYNTLGGIAWQQGRQNDALVFTSRAADLYEYFGDDAGAATARTNMGILLFSAGRWDEAEEQFSRADDIRKSIGSESERPRGLVNLAILEIAKGKRDQARRDLGEAVTLSRAFGQRYITARAELAFAHLELLDGNAEAACSHLGTASASSCLCEDDQLQVTWLQALIECDRGGPQRGIELAEQARKMARDAGLVDSEADCCRALGTAYRRSNQRDHALQALSDAVLLAEQTGNPYRRALALLDLGEVCHENEDCDRARASVIEAADVFRSLGASADLARAEALRQKVA